MRRSEIQMETSTLKFHKAIGGNLDAADAEESSWFFLICGPSCIGKSTFIKESGFYAHNPLTHVNPNLITETFIKNNPITPKYDHKRGFIQYKFSGLRGHHEVAVNSNPKYCPHCGLLTYWPNGWFSEDYIIKIKAIILGIPLEEWLKRIHERKRHLVMKRLPKITKLEAIYNRWLTVLNNNNIPYIFVDNRNDYPILDESSFFTMIRS